MGTSTPTVMISSTFYDLRQVRADLADFLSNEMHYEALISEQRSFPIDPDVNTIENCRRRVEQDADMLILVIGGRYGSVDSASSKSVTNLEYLAARAKGIPIYVFIEKGVHAILPVWEANPDANFKSVVDDSRVFGFIREIRSIHQVWTQEFEVAQNIIAALRIQFAHLTRDGIRLRERLRTNSSDSKLLNSLHGKALRLFLEQPSAWKYRLFAQILIDEIEAASELRHEHRLGGLALGVGERIPTYDFQSWVQPRFSELERIAEALEALINTHAHEALETGNAEFIVFVAQRIGVVYREAIEWAFRVQRAIADDVLKPVQKAMVRFPDDIIQKVERVGSDFLQQIEDALPDASLQNPKFIDRELEFRMSNLEEFQNALRVANEQIRNNRRREN